MGQWLNKQFHWGSQFHPHNSVTPFSSPLSICFAFLSRWSRVDKERESIRINSGFVASSLTCGWRGWRRRRRRVGGRNGEEVPWLAFSNLIDIPSKFISGFIIHQLYCLLLLVLFLQKLCQLSTFTLDGVKCLPKLHGDQVTDWVIEAFAEDLLQSTNDFFPSSSSSTSSFSCFEASRLWRNRSGNWTHECAHRLEGGGRGT